MHTYARFKTDGFNLVKFTRPTFAAALVLLIACASLTQAQEQWTGGAGADDKWSTDANWMDNSAPVNPYSGTIYFMDTDAGNINTVDHDWDIAGLWYSNTTGAAHTTDLGGSNLIVRGNIFAGYKSSNSRATIQNGILQLGTATTPLDMYIGWDTDYSTPNPERTNNNLTISGTINATNARNIYVARHYTYSNYKQSEATLDLSGATISSQGRSNVLRANNIWVGYGHYYLDYAIGLLKLPTSLQSLELTGDLAVGYGYTAGAVGSVGVVDFGVGTSLTNLLVSGSLTLADENAAYGVLSNLPPNVALTVGLPSTPGNLYIARAPDLSSPPTTTLASLVLSNGTFRGYLNQVIIGQAGWHVSGVATGLLDLVNETVQIGGETNKFKGLSTLWIGKGWYGSGTVRLPTNITEIAVGELQVGMGGNYARANGFLDIGSNSQLHVLTASNGFHLSTRDGMGQIGYQGANGFVDYLPTGLVFTVGSPTTNVPLYMSTSIGLYDTHTTGTLALVNGTFRGYLSALIIGSNTAYYGDNVGLLDLSSSSVQIGNEPNKVKVDKLILAGFGGPSTYGGGGQKSTVLFPSTVTHFIVGDLEVGSGGGDYTTGKNQGLLDFGANSQLQLFSVTNSFYMGSYNAQYGRITGLPTNGLAASFGQASHRIPMYMGYKTNKGYEGTPPVGEAILRLTNAIFSAYLTDLMLGVCDCTGSWGDGNGELNLASSTLTALDVSGLVRVGQGSNTYSGKARGYLKLPTGNASCGTMYIGSPNASFSAGVVELNGTRFTVTNNLVIENTGRLTNHVFGVSGGIDFTRADPSAFVITNSGKMHLAFDSDPVDTGNWYWGLRMAGDQTAYFQALNTAGNLTWSTNALAPKFVKRFGIVYDGKTDETYVGVAQLTNPGILFQAL